MFDQEHLPFIVERIRLLGSRVVPALQIRYVAE